MAHMAMKAAPDRLLGTDKVVALLLSIDQDVARNVIKHFDQDELRRLAMRASLIGKITARAVEPIISEMLIQLSEEDPDIVVAPAKAEQLLSGAATPETVAEIMSEVYGSSNQYFWKQLPTVSESVLARYLSREHPQTIAAILSRLSSSFSATVLGELPAHVRNRVVGRMLKSRPLCDPASRILETVLRHDLLATEGSSGGSDSKARVAGIINQMERDQVEDVLKSIEDLEPAIGRELRGLIFSFDDIPTLSERARSILFDRVATDVLLMALRGAGEALKSSVLPVLGARTRRMVEAELASGDMPAQKDILKSQRLIADTALRLNEDGVIEISAQQLESSDPA